MDLGALGCGLHGRFVEPKHETTNARPQGQCTWSLHVDGSTCDRITDTPSFVLYVPECTPIWLRSQPTRHHAGVRVTLSRHQTLFIRHLIIISLSLTIPVPGFPQHLCAAATSQGGPAIDGSQE